MESYRARAPQVEGTGNAKALTILGRVRSIGEFLGLRLVTRVASPAWTLWEKSPLSFWVG